MYLSTIRIRFAFLFRAPPPIIILLGKYRLVIASQRDSTLSDQCFISVYLPHQCTACRPEQQKYIYIPMRITETCTHWHRPRVKLYILIINERAEKSVRI